MIEPMTSSARRADRCPPASWSTPLYTGISHRSSRLGRVGSCVSSAGPGSTRSGDSREPSDRTAAAAEPPSRAGSSSGSWHTGCGTSPRFITTRISATTPSTPAASGCSCCSRAGGRRRRGSTRSCSAFRSTPFASGWTRPTTSPSIASSSRTCSGSRNTCWTRPASGCCRCRAAWAACRTTPTRRSRPPTRAFRPSRCQPASRFR